MIGLLALAAVGLWLSVVVRLSKLVPAWLGISKFQAVMSVGVFILFTTLPFSDDIIGKWQFRNLCEKNNFVTLDPEWRAVKRAVRSENSLMQLEGYAIPIQVQKVMYIDMDTQKKFLALNAFHTSGGFLQRHLYGMGGLTSCWPEKTNETLALVKTSDLIRAGENASKGNGQ